MLHRDLKPSNVLVDAEDRPRVLDFGIARSLGNGDEATATTLRSGFLGTLAYTAPELLRSPPNAVPTNWHARDCAEEQRGLASPELPLVA